MNWDAVGAVAELVGALGVLVTLIYLAMQIRQNTESMQAAAREAIAERDVEWLYKMVDHPELVNDDCMGEAWMVEIEMTDPGQADGLLSADDYAKVVAEAS